MLWHIFPKRFLEYWRSRRNIDCNLYWRSAGGVKYPSQIYRMGPKDLSSGCQERGELTSATSSTAPVISICSSSTRTIRCHRTLRGRIWRELVCRSRAVTVAHEVTERILITAVQGVDSSIVDVVRHVGPAFTPHAVVVGKGQSGWAEQKEKCASAENLLCFHTLYSWVRFQ